MAKKVLTDYTMTCRCGARMPIYLLPPGLRFMGQCFGCGAVCFGPTPLLARLKYGDTICGHELEPTPCKGGSTTWCGLCRIRTFYYGQEARTAESHT